MNGNATTLAPDDAALDQAAALVLDKAADHIERQGLARGSFADSQGRLCVIGAINLAGCGYPQGGYITAIYDRAVLLRAVLLLMAAIRAAGHTELPVTWNDTECGSVDEAAAMLRAAARTVTP